MISLPELNLNEELVLSLRRHLRIPDGYRLLDGTLEPPASLVSIVDPYEHTHRFQPKTPEVGLEVHELFSRRFPFRSHADWLAKQHKGFIGVNDSPTQESHKITASDTLFHRNIGVVEPSAPSEIRVIAENEHFLWIDKPAPLPMHSGGRYHRNTVVSMLEHNGMGSLFVVHRLDAVTSGLVLLAKSESAASLATSLISEQQTQKSYEAIVCGNPPSGEHEISIGIKRDHGFLFRCSDESDAKSAKTLFNVIYQGDDWAHVRCLPITGRTHQIRLHLAYWGYPIWDDLMYNGLVFGSQRLKLRQDRAISLVSLGFKT
jgi:RluA family pseudouridine synthase